MSVLSSSSNSRRRRRMKKGEQERCIRSTTGDAAENAALLDTQRNEGSQHHVLQSLEIWSAELKLRRRGHS